jgi:hypothetical protein
MLKHRRSTRGLEIMPSGKFVKRKECRNNFIEEIEGK